MKVTCLLGIVGAILMHAAVLLFGGIFFLHDEENHGTLQEVDLIADDATAKEKDKPQQEESKPEEKEEIETEVEEAPDAAEIVRNLELSAAASAPALDAASLSAIEQALAGQTSAGDFASAVTFASGGRIGGMASRDSLDEKLENAFSLAEIDQKPRAVFQAAPIFPSEMRGKKVEGVVTIIFVVDSAGKVESPRVEKSTHPAFEKPAMDAVKQWKFEPAIRAGQRVGCKMRVPIRFQAS